jgi:mono/diheme cytochrome c family protein
VTRTTSCKTFVVAMALGTLLCATAARAADDATVKLYQTKCAACHGADGSGATTVGKALKLKDIRDAESQKISDADMATLVAKGKDKMPANEKTLKPEQIKSLVAYVRELAQKK